jgi:hypothetical protein
MKELSNIEKESIIEYFMKYIIEHPDVNPHITKHILETKDRLYYGGLGQSICEWNMYLFKFKNCPYTPRYNVIIR